MNSPNPSPQAHKYRPYFSAEEMLEVITALKSQPTPARIGIIRYLENFSIKIHAGIMAPSHTAKPTILQRLELQELPPHETFKYSGETLYNKWKLAPATISPAELDMVNEYRYSNDLMTPTEEEQYEHANGIFTSP